METMPRRPSPFAAALNTLVTLTLVVAVLIICFLLWPFAVKQWQTGSPAQATAQPALSAPTLAPQPQYAPQPVVTNPPIVVQQAPAGEAPQPVQFIPVAPPAESAPAERPLIIVQHVDDSGHQVITGSGACAVARGARRCGK